MSADITKLIIQFDSSTALLKNLALCLNNEDLKGVGVAPEVPPWVGGALNAIPFKIRQGIYSWSGWLDAVKDADLENINTEEVARWVTGFYPQTSLPGVMFGSSNGAAIHLAAALGMAWLPQTYLVAVRRRLGPDEIRKDIAWGKKTMRPLLRRCPEFHAAQMHDPVQDRLMVSKMGYFRMKLLSIPQEFENFLSHHIGPGKPMITVECTYAWPSLRVEKRHTFQLGGFGALEPYEYLAGSRRTRDFLKNCKSPLTDWGTFKATQECPEAEWGFYRQPLDQLKKIAQRHGAPFWRLVFGHPEGLSVFLCDLYEWWYQKRRRIKCTRLIIENFALTAPHRVMVSGTLPFWLAFNTQNSARLLEKYLAGHSFDEIYLLLMSNGIKEGVGLASIDCWKGILQQARKKGQFVGVDEHKYPLDFATYLRFQQKMQEDLPDRYPRPKPLTMAELKEFLDKNPLKYPLKWQEY